METAPHGLDEISLAPPPTAEIYRRIERLFLGQGREQLSQLQGQARKLMRDLGVVYRLYHEDPSYDHIVPLDLFPRVIGAEEWERLSRGITQRLRIWNSFLQDVYSHQEVLKAGIVPFQVVYDDPGFLRAATGLPLVNDTFVHTAAFDLARDHQGKWTVIEDYVSTMTGPSYAMQARHVVGQVLPDLLNLAELHRINTYPTRLLEILQDSGGNRPLEPRVVFLSSDEDNHAYYEHSLLARQMGVPLVRGDDLIVLNSRVYLKTIGGLEPIDVIYRQLDAAVLDPLEFQQDSPLGVPGLMNCVRKGTVAMANAVGSSLGKNRALASFMPKLARFYFNEPLILPTVNRLLCFDRDQCDLALSQLAASRVCLISGQSEPSDWFPGAMTEEAADQLAREIRRRRQHYVAEPVLPLSLLPVAGQGGLVRRHAGLRLFAMGGPSAKVFPCGLTRYSLEENSRVISAGLGGGIKDTWILGRDGADRKDAPLILGSSQRRLRLSSRIAENLYWMGRHKSRAENTTRILKVLQQIQLEDQSMRNLRSWAPLWEALARATGHATHFFKRSSHVRKQSVSQYILLEPDNPSSVLSSIRNLRANARASRESIPPELWSIINKLYQNLLDARGQQWFDQTEWPQLRALEDDVLLQLDALTGAAANDMLRDDGAHFWNMGDAMERAINTLLVTRQVFMRRQSNGSQIPQRDESNLDALLRILGCQYAYRSLFQTRPLFQNVARMIFQDRQLGKSVLSCLAGIRDSLEDVFGHQAGRIESPHELPPLRLCAHLIGEIEYTDFTPFFEEPRTAHPKRFRPWLDGVARKLDQLAVSIGDHYLHHQLFKILQ